MSKRVLIVDDDPGIRDALSLLLEDHGSYEAFAAEGGSAALELLQREEAALVLCDVAMPGMDGITLLETIRRRYPELPVVMISAHGDLETAVTAVRGGAYDYLLKPIDEKRLFHTMERALEYQQLRADYGTLREEARDELLMIGESEPMRRLRAEIDRAAPSDARILILGENGTGKELVAKLIHERSRRRDRPFVKLNSAAIPKELIESELFGHEAGAFTGATKPKKGKLELASSGTLFLDEIGDMAPETQAKLLRVLSTNEYERVGGGRLLRFDARLLTASNRDLQRSIEDGEFREDLYHRIAVIPIRVPTLRERGKDVEILAEHFLGSFCANYGRTPPEIKPAARGLLAEYAWPGNVRELRNLMERIAIMHPSAVLEVDDLSALLGPTATAPRGTGGTAPQSLSDRWKEAKLEEETEMVRRTLEESGWNVTLASRRLGIDRASLHRKMKRLGIARPGRD